MQYTLRPWKFGKNEIVVLYWLGAPFQDKEHYWYIRTLFQRKDLSLVEIVYPFGSLPVLRVGQKYQNGMINKEAVGEYWKLRIPQDIQFSLCRGFEIPRSLYAFAKCPEYGNQYLCRFNLNGRNFYVPCAEVVRSIYAPHVVYTNAILTTNGLEELIEDYKLEGTQIKILFSKEYPKSMLTNKAVAYFSWIRFHPDIWSNWKQVYSMMLSDALKVNSNDIPAVLSKGIPIKAFLPSSFEYGLRFRGLNYENHFLILEVAAIENLIQPFQVINYSSSTLVQNVWVETNHKSEANNKDQLIVIQDILGGRAKRYAKTYDTEIPMTNSRFLNPPKVKRYYLNSFKRYLPEKGDEEELPSGGMRKSYYFKGTTQDWAMGGNLNRVEFKPYDDIDQKKYPEFSKFFDLIQSFQESGIINHIEADLILLSDYKGRTRRCVVIKLKLRTGSVVFLVEINRSGSESSSTLLLYPNMQNDASFISKFFSRLLEETVNNHFHWKRDSLNQIEEFRIELMRHVYGQSAKEWGKRIYKKLNE